MSKTYSIKNPKGLPFRGVSFNEYFVASKPLNEWIKYGKAQYEGRPFFGRADEKVQEEYLTHVHKLATEMTGAKEVKAESKAKGTP